VRVTYRQSGGFSGLVRGCDLDTEKMAPQEAAKLASLLERCEFSEEKTTAPDARDALVHEISVVGDDGVMSSVLFDELSIPSSAGPLLEFLEVRSSPRKT